MEKHLGHLSLEERRKIWKYRKLGYGVRRIAREIGRSPSAISREFERNVNGGEDWIERANQAHQMARSRRTRANEGKTRLKSVRIQRFVEEELKKKVSPELIALRLKFLKSDVLVSHEAIYQWIREERPDLIQYLIICGKSRRRRRGKKIYRPKQPAAPKVSIDERPEEINNRTAPGHWEGDLMVSRQSKYVLLHLRERKLRFSKLVKLPDAKAQTVKQAIIKVLSLFPGELALSLTLDNGSENALHVELSSELEFDVFFCHAYHAWEKGTVENGNGRVREDLPKGTDFELVPDVKIQAIEDRLNNRPMKCLAGMTPAEAMNQLFQEHLH